MHALLPAPQVTSTSKQPTRTRWPALLNCLRIFFVRFSRAHGVVVSHPLSMREALGSIPSVSIVYERFHRRNQVNVIMRSVSLPCAEHALRMLRSTSAVVKLKRESNNRNMRTHVAPEKVNFRSCLRALLTPCIRER